MLSVRTDKVDGRHARVEAGKSRVFEALIALGVEGHDDITFSLIARRAGISIRTMSRYFPTHEDFVVESSHYFQDRLAPYFTLQAPSGDLEHRLDSLVRLRLEFLRDFDYHLQALTRMSHEYSSAREILDRRRRDHSSQFEVWLKEARAPIDPGRWEVLRSIVDCETLRSIQSQLGDQTRGAVVSAVLTLLG